MDASALKAAYAQFLEAAGEARGASVPEGQWRTELVLAHVLVADRLIAAAAARALAGGQPSFDNRACQSVPYLEAVAEAAGDWDGLLDGVRRGRDELAATLERIGPEQAGTVVQAFIVDGDRTVFEGPLPLEQLLTVPALRHVPGHAEQLLSFRASHAGSAR